MFYLIIVIICYFLIIFVHKYLLRILEKKVNYRFDVLQENFKGKGEDTEDKSDTGPKNNPAYADEKQEEELIQLSQDELKDELDNYLENIDDGVIKESNAFNTEYSLDEKQPKPLDSFYDIANKEKYEVQENNWVPSNENILNGGEIFNGVQGYSDDSMFSSFS